MIASHPSISHSILKNFEVEELARATRISKCFRRTVMEFCSGLSSPIAHALMPRVHISYRSLDKAQELVLLKRASRTGGLLRSLTALFPRSRRASPHPDTVFFVHSTTKQFVTLRHSSVTARVALLMFNRQVSSLPLRYLSRIKGCNVLFRFPVSVSFSVESWCGLSCGVGMTRISNELWTISSAYCLVTFHFENYSSISLSITYQV